ncbi:MAG: AtpZ/AtpI family protein [Patescibacteria group bacterium]
MSNVLALAFQLGYIIALPAALFAFGGATLDKRLDTSPLFILLGLALAISSSSLLIARLIRRMNLGVEQSAKRE